MSIRFSDNILSNIEGSDFVIRNRVPKSVQLLLIFLGAFDLICLSFYLTDDAGVNFTFLAILLLSIGALGYATYFFINRFRNLILATEFQTAMLASATQLGTRFCFIVNSDGLVFYVDPGFQKMFAGFVDSGSRTLKELFMFIETPVETKERILATLKRNKSDQVILTFKDTNGNPLSMVTSIDVIPRPKGYFVIRGRDFIEKRTDEKVGDPKEKANTMLLLDKTLYHMQGGILIANLKGVIVFANHELEKFLGYGPDEMAQSKLPLSQVFHQYMGHDADALVFADFDGQVTVKNKQGNQLSVQVHQRLVGDDNETIGINALIKLD